MTDSKSCEKCGNSFRPSAHDVKRGFGKFCSRSCARQVERRTPDQAFWARVSKTETCWFWTGAKLPRGYGNFAARGSRIYAHRHSYEIHIGLVPEGQFVLHRCDEPSCVNPEHLFLGTHNDNMKDMRVKKRGTPWKKLDEESVREIRHLALTTSLAALAARFSVSAVAIGKVVSRKSWKHVP